MTCAEAQLEEFVPIQCKHCKSPIVAVSRIRVKILNTVMQLIVNKKPRGFMQNCFPFLCILNVVVIFYYIFINV